MHITDQVTLADVRVNDSGYLEAFAHTARTGVQTYAGKEVGKPDLLFVNVFRDEVEVFSKASLESFSKIPLCIDHPPEPVNAQNWKKYAVGTTGDEVLRDGERLKIGLKITDKAAVDAVRAGKRELSVGYATDLVWEEGVAPDGTPYQARQTAIVADHIAIVAAGRAGPQCRIGDSWPATTPEEKLMTLKTVTVDGIPIEVTDQGATVIATLQQRITDANTAKDKLVTDHATALAAKDADLAKKDAEIDSLKAKVMTDADLDKRVAARATLINTARAIAKDVKTDGLTDADIRKAVVTAKLGDAAVKDKTDAYIDARYEILVEDAQKGNPDAFRDVVRDGIKTNDDRTTVDQAHTAMVTNIQDAWKNKGAA